MHGNGVKMRARRVIIGSVRQRNVPSVEEMEKVKIIPAGIEVLIFERRVVGHLIRAFVFEEVDVILQGWEISKVVRPFYVEKDMVQTNDGEDSDT